MTAGIQVTGLVITAKARVAVEGRSLLRLSPEPGTCGEHGFVFRFLTLLIPAANHSLT
jgi:hypothetical protein